MKTLNKVVEITLIFWLMKIVATTLGETFGDFISQTLNLGYYVGLGITFVLFILFLVLQLNTKRYIPTLFWLVIIGTTTFGTEISDFIDRSLHLGYAWGSLLLFSGLIITLILWYKTYGNIDVEPMIERKKEIYFWIAVLFSNSLGTAFGDFLGDNLGLSYLQGALITGIIIIFVVLLHYFTKINQIVLFWIAFIFTRPLGATFGDFLTKPIEKGGLDLGTLNASLVSILLMAILIFLTNQNHSKNIQNPL